MERSGTGPSRVGLVANPGFLPVVGQALIGPVAAFFTFIGSMGNIPLAALLFGHGVSFAGVMAFIFSDLAVFPVLRINATYYGWKMALYILIMLLSGLVIVSVCMHYGLALLDLLPRPEHGQLPAERDHFSLNGGFFLNIIFIVLSGIFIWLAQAPGQDEHGEHDHHHHGDGNGSSVPAGKRILQILALTALTWLAVGGLLLPFLV